MEDLAALAGAVVDEARERGDVFREYAVLTDLGYAQAARGRLTRRGEPTPQPDHQPQLGDPAGEAMALNNIGAICERQGELDAALGYARRWRCARTWERMRRCRNAAQRGGCAVLAGALG